jgi:hypothetical protein
MRRRRLGVIAAVIVWSGCVAIQVPRPGNAVPPVPAPKPQLSPLIVPVSLDLAALQSIAEENLPVEESQETDWQDAGSLIGVAHFQYKYHIWRDPIPKPAWAGDTMSVAPSFHYRLRGRITGLPVPVEGSCGYDSDPLKRVDAKLSSKVTWSTDWSLSPSTRIDPLTFVDACRVTAAQIDATPILQFLVNRRLGPAAAQIDARIPQITAFQTKAATGWKALQQPLKLSDQVWLVIQPDSLFITPLLGSTDQQSVNTTVVISARPLVSAGAQPVVNEKPLPQWTQGSAPVGPFKVVATLLITYAEATGAALAKLKGKSYSIPGGKLTVESLEIYGSGEFSIVAVDVTGSVRGTLYLQGKPVYDNTSATVTVQNLDYTLDTSNVLAKVASWLLHGPIQAKIAAELNFPVGDKVNGFRTTLNQQTNRTITDRIKLQGSIDKIDFGSVIVAREGIVVSVESEGSLQVLIQ